MTYDHSLLIIIIPLNHKHKSDQWSCKNLFFSWKLNSSILLQIIYFATSVLYLLLHESDNFSSVFVGLWFLFCLVVWKYVIGNAISYTWIGDLLSHILIIITPEYNNKHKTFKVRQKKRSIKIPEVYNLQGMIYSCKEANVLILIGLKPEMYLSHIYKLHFLYFRLSPHVIIQTLLTDSSSVFAVWLCDLVSITTIVCHLI